MKRAVMLTFAAVLVAAPLPARALRSTRTRARRDENVAESLRGRVVDTSGSALGAVLISVPELDRQVTTGDDGAFAFANVPAGAYTVIARRSGFATVVQRVDAAGAAEVEIRMRPIPFELQGVTVTATRGAISSTLSPLPATALGSEDLHRDNGVSLSHTIERLAGVRTLSTGMQIGKPMIRGLTGARVLVLEDGHRLEDYSWSDEDGPSIDARLADRVEVIRGPASVLYGSEALGGVVNVIPAEVPDAVGRDAFMHTGIELYGESVNGEFGTALRAEGASGSFGWRAFVTGRKAADFDTPDGELENTGFGAVNAELVGGTRGTWGSTQLRIAHYGGEFKLLEAGDNPNVPIGGQPGEEKGPERKTLDDRVQFDSKFPMSSMLLETKLQFQRHWLAEEAEQVDAGGGGGVVEEEFELVLNTFSLDVLGHHSLSENVHGTIGVSGTLQNHETEGEIQVVPNAKSISGGAFAFEGLTAGQWELLGGLRLDARRLEPEGLTPGTPEAETRNYTALTANAGAVFHALPWLAFTGNVGRAWRSPTLFELYADGPRIGEARYEIGRADLDTEKALDADIGLRIEGDRVRVELAGFRNGINDYIYLTPTNQMIDDLRVYRHVQADARLWGGEASAEVQAAPGLMLRGRFDYVRGDNLETDEPLPLMPPRRGDLGIEWNTRGLGWAERAYVTVDTEIIGEQTRLNTFDFATDGYTLLNFGAGIGTHLGGKTLRADLHVHNAADKSYRSFLSRYKEFALDPGRSIGLRVSLGI